MDQSHHKKCESSLTQQELQHELGYEMIEGV